MAVHRRFPIHIVADQPDIANPVSWEIVDDAVRTRNGARQVVVLGGMEAHYKWTFGVGRTLAHDSKRMFQLIAFYSRHRLGREFDFAPPVSPLLESVQPLRVQTAKAVGAQTMDFTRAVEVGTVIQFAGDTAVYMVDDTNHIAPPLVTAFGANKAVDLTPTARCVFSDDIIGRFATNPEGLFGHEFSIEEAR